MEGRKLEVAEAVAESKAAERADIVAAADALLAKLKETPAGAQHIHSAPRQVPSSERCFSKRTTQERSEYDAEAVSARLSDGGRCRTLADGCFSDTYRT